MKIARKFCKFSRHQDYETASRRLMKWNALCRQAFVGNVSTCRKVQARHVDRITELMCQFTEQVPEYLDILHCMVRIDGLETPPRRNQALVMKHLMKVSSQIAKVFSWDRDSRYWITQTMASWWQWSGGNCLTRILTCRKKFFLSDNLFFTNARFGAKKSSF